MKVLIKKALQYHPSVVVWKRFRYGVFIVWPNSKEELDFFFNYMSKIDSIKMIPCSMEVKKVVLEFLDLRLKFGKQSKHISVEIF